MVKPSKNSFTEVLLRRCMANIRHFQSHHTSFYDYNYPIFSIFFFLIFVEFFLFSLFCADHHLIEILCQKIYNFNSILYFKISNFNKTKSLLNIKINWEITRKK